MVKLCQPHSPSSSFRRSPENIGGGLLCIWENTPRALSPSLSFSLVLMHAIVDEWLQVTAKADWIWNFTSILEHQIGKSQYIPVIIADNRLRRRYRSAKMEILVSKFDAAFKGFGGSFKRLPRAEITPRPFDCSPWMTKTGGEKFYYTGHVSGILNRNFTRFLFDLLLLQRYVRWRKKIRGIQGSGARGENISSRGCTYSKYAGNQYGINIYIYT